METDTIVELVKGGLNTATELADELDAPRGTVNGHLARAVEAGLLAREKEGRGYVYFAPEAEADEDEDEEPAARAATVTATPLLSVAELHADEAEDEEDEDDVFVPEPGKAAVTASEVYDALSGEMTAKEIAEHFNVNVRPARDRLNALVADAKVMMVKRGRSNVYMHTDEANEPDAGEDEEFDADAHDEARALVAERYADEWEEMSAVARTEAINAHLQAVDEDDRDAGSR